MAERKNNYKNIKSGVYNVPTMEFCAIDRANNVQFFLNSVCPGVKDKINEANVGALDLIYYNGSYDEEKLDECYRHILDDNDLPYNIPFKVIRRVFLNGEECYLCKEMFYRSHVFYLPARILHTRYCSIDQLSLYFNARVSMNTLFESFKWLLNHPEQENEISSHMKKRRR